MDNAGHYELAPLIDHTLLRPEATERDYVRLCGEAVEYGFFAVCLPPFFVPLARTELANSRVRLCTVVGFPMGYDTTTTKIRATEQAVDEGADEIDVVLNGAALRSGLVDVCETDIRSVVRAAHGRLVKVILECALLTADEIVVACRLSEAAGAHFVKTSTGFAGHGARVEDVVRMRAAVSPHIGVKASGGIAATSLAIDLVRAGASRLGTSRSLEILRGV
jgi:deoxyribose-phosphate aldolase